MNVCSSQPQTENVAKSFPKSDYYCPTQEVLYSRHGKHAKEALFYTHALPLPGFLLLGHDILRSNLQLDNSI